MTKGEKGKRAMIMKNKIIEDNVLIEDEELDNEQNQEDEYQEDEIEEEGKYPPSSDEEDLYYEEDGEMIPYETYIPRVKHHAYMQAEGAVLRVRKNNMKFTKGTNPEVKDIMTFMVDESIGCPYYLPLDPADAKVTNFTLNAAIHNEHIPLSEHIKKENYYKFYQGFNKAIMADPALIKTEILLKMKQFDALYGIIRSEEE